MVVEPRGSRLYVDELPTIPTWAQQLMLTLDVDALVAEVMAGNMPAAYPDQLENQAFVAQLTASVQENVGRLRTFLAGQIDLDHVVLTQPHTLAAMVAQLGIPASAMNRSYRVGFGIMWDELSALVTRGASEQGIDAQEVLPVLHELTALILRYQHHVASQVSETHAREERALSQSRDHLRYALVRQLLRGEGTLSPADVVSLGYDLASHHVAVHLPDVPEGAAGRLLVGLRERAAVRQSLLFPVSTGRTTLWLGRSRSWRDDELAALVAFLRSSGVTASVSRVHAGPDGFRRTAEELDSVEEVRRRRGDRAAPVTTYSEVALDCLLLADPVGSAAFVRDELAGLAAPTTEAQRLRETLEAWLERGSHVGAAEALSLHEHTVRNRLQRVEELLGHDIRQRRTEVDVALRLHRLTAPDTR